MTPNSGKKVNASFFVASLDGAVELWVMCSIHTKKANLVLVELYLDCGIGVAGMNMSILSQLNLFLKMIKARFANWKKEMQTAEPRGPFRDF